MDADDPLFIPEQAKMPRANVATLAWTMRKLWRRDWGLDLHESNRRVRDLIFAGYDDGAIQAKAKVKS